MANSRKNALHGSKSIQQLLLVRISILSKVKKKMGEKPASLKPIRKSYKSYY